MLQLTEPVIKSLPEIIKQASQSPRGILALLVIVLFGLACYFFRGAALGARVLIWLILFGGTATYGWEITRVATKPGAVHYVGRIIDKVSKNPLSEALISLMPTPQTQAWSSDSDGRFSFWVTRKRPSDDVQMQVDHVNYERYTRTVSSDESSQLGDIPLGLIVAGANAGASAGGTPPAPVAGSDASSPPAPGPAARDHSAVAAMIPHPRPPVVPPAAISMFAVASAKVVMISSGPKLSGARKDFSEWYRLGAGAAPEGYTVEKTEFWLSGDRTCGAWAECREVSKSDTEVVWEFRLQGHDEWGAPPQAYSEGHLRITYKLK
jgi:hypothetical protein